MPTITTPAMTQAGMILGTAAYMSPEQAKGRIVDKRADVWAFGCVLYEMLTGRRAYEGEDVSDTLAAVLRGEPDWSAVPPQVSATVVAYLRRCLVRDPAQRVHDMADVRLALEGAFDVPAPPIPSTPAANVRETPWPLIAAAGAVLAVAAAALGAIGGPIFFPRRPTAVVRLTATPVTGVTPTDGAPDIAVSPDGSRFAYVTVEQDRTRLYVRSLSQLDPVPIEAGLPRSPFFSPDGQWVGFFDSLLLKRVSSSGGPAVTIATVTGIGRGASWAKDDTIVFATNATTGLLRVPAAGGEPTVLTKPDTNQDHLFPEMLPGERAVLFSVVSGGQTAANAQLAVLDLASGTQKVVLSAASSGKYASSGHLVYGISGTLRAVPFDLDTLTVRGTAVPVIERVVTKINGSTNFALAADGSLVYETGDSAGAAERILAWVDRQGREEPLEVPKRAYTYPRISADGTRIALDIRDQENDIWLWDVVRRTMTRLTFDMGLNRGVVWMPDGKRLVFSAERDGPESLFSQAADGSGSPERLTTAQPGRPQVPYTVTPDGARVLFGEPGQPPYDLHQLELGTDRKVTPLLNATYNEQNADMSPDGRWVAYQSSESGADEIYIRPFPNVSAGRWQISTGGGTRPAWARNGREIFYLKSDGTLIAVPIESGGERLVVGVGKALFQGPYFRGQTGRTYDVSSDGQRFLMIRNAATTMEQRPTQIVVVLNFFEELKRLAPAP
jgi:serine/threonine-protein kinase